jgi:serine/threonine-protein kinase
VLGGVRANPLTSTSEFAVARNGTLAYVPGHSGAPLGRVAWIDREGTVVLAVPERQRFTVPRLSRSGRYLAVGIAGPGTDIWRYDLKQAPPTRLRLTRDGLSVLSVWSPDERSICYSSGRTGRMQIYCRAADGSAEPRLLQASDHSQVPTTWSPDSRFIAYMEHRPETGFDIWIKPLEGDAPPWLVAGGPFDEFEPSFSPDGRWIAYTSTESGAEEIYVQAVGGDGARYPVSIGGGANPVWRGDEIRYRRGSKMMVVEVTTEPEFAVSTPVSLFDGLPQGLIPARMYDLEHAGERIVVTLPDEQTQRPYHEVKIVTGWVDLQRRRLQSAAGD